MRLKKALKKQGKEEREEIRLIEKNIGHLTRIKGICVDRRWPGKKEYTIKLWETEQGRLVQTIRTLLNQVEEGIVEMHIYDQKIIRLGKKVLGQLEQIRNKSDNKDVITDAESKTFKAIEEIEKDLQKQKTVVSELLKESIKTALNDKEKYKSFIQNIQTVLLLGYKIQNALKHIFQLENKALLHLKEE